MEILVRENIVYCSLKGIGEDRDVWQRDRYDEFGLFLKQMGLQEKLFKNEILGVIMRFMKRINYS